MSERQSDLDIGERVRVLPTGELATVTAIIVPYMRLVRVDGDADETHVRCSDLEVVSDE
jgi:hypothetical protein